MLVAHAQLIHLRCNQPALRTSRSIAATAVCAALSHAQSFPQTVQSGSFEGCIKNVAVLKSNQQWARYGPAVYPTWQQFQEAAVQLGFSVDTDWLRLPRPTNEDYENYLWQLAAPEQKPARDEFVRRILATK